MRIVSAPPDLRKALKAMRGKFGNRRQCDMTQKQVAYKAGVTIKTIEKSECDPYELTLHALEKILHSHGKRLAIVTDNLSTGY